ncbi:MAG TPA: serine/threonine-protein kinase, partial [Gemmatimonadaceae bacterium]|nr:serine/threonine-protein kinase [Gemmatimonadaceae bacterium]
MTDTFLSPEFLALQRAVAGRYSLVRELGRGGMGIVFLARDVALDRPVAIKLLPLALSAEAAFRERFLREARTAASLAHPNIVPIHAVDEAHDLVYFVMAFVDGESLGERVRRRGPLPAVEVMRVVQEVAYALSHAHARGIVHRDIKPDNILLERDGGRALVTDFGIARASGQTPASGVPAGTPHYLSPEAARGEAADARSDLYALGVTACFALTGRHPFEADTLAALLVRQATESPPALESLAPGVPARVAAVVDRCLQREPGERWRSAEALAREIDRIRARDGETAPAVRAWVREVVPAGNDVSLGLAGAVSSVSVLTILSWLEGGTGLAAGITDLLIGVTMVATVALFGGLSIVRFGSTAMATRDLVEQGYDHAAASLALEQAEAEQAADLASMPLAARRRRAWLYGLTGAAKTALALWVATLDNHAWLAFPAAMGAVLIPPITLRAIIKELATGPSVWSRMLRGRVGRLLFRGVRLAARRREQPVVG